MRRRPTRCRLTRTRRDPSRLWSRASASYGFARRAGMDNSHGVRLCFVDHHSACSCLQGPMAEAGDAAECRHAAGERRGSIWRASTAWRPGTNGGSMPPRPGQFFEREPGHRKLDVRFACFRRASSMIRKEIATRSSTTPRSPFHGRGRAVKGRSCGFFEIFA